ncbi:MAG: STAS domain-containing protein [Planctomycetia bacterium]|nr:STAS domain-containing protein [Planctomycetia bacterium]
MEIKEQRDGDSLTIWISGRLDTNTAPEAETRINNALEGIKHLMLDLADLEYVSSAGLRTILCLHKTMEKREKGGLKIAHLKDEVKEIFEITGFTVFLNIV